MKIHQAGNQVLALSRRVTESINRTFDGTDYDDSLQFSAPNKVKFDSSPMPGLTRRVTRSLKQQENSEDAMGVGLTVDHDVEPGGLDKPTFNVNKRATRSHFNPITGMEETDVTHDLQGKKGIPLNFFVLNHRPTKSYLNPITGAVEYDSYAPPTKTPRSPPP